MFTADLMNVFYLSLHSSHQSSSEWVFMHYSCRSFSLSLFLGAGEVFSVFWRISCISLSRESEACVNANEYLSTNLCVLMTVLTLTTHAFRPKPLRELIWWCVWETDTDVRGLYWWCCLLIIERVTERFGINSFICNQGYG